MRDPIQLALDRRLQGLGMADSLKQGIRERAALLPGKAPLRLKISLRLALILALLALTITAFALTRGFGLFELMGSVLPHFSQVRPEAEALLRRDLAFYRFPHVDVAIREAAYDGRYLRVAYSVRDRAAAETLDEPGKSLIEGRKDIYDFQAAKQDGIWWSTMDWAEVEGQHVYPLGMAISLAGPENGEAISWVQFDVRDMDLPDTFSVLLPVKGYDTPRELMFTMDKGDMSSVYHLKPPPDKRIGNYVVHIEDIIISPIRTYITAHILVDSGAAPEEIWAIASKWANSATLSGEDGSQPQQWADTASGPLDNMTWVRLELPDGSVDYEDRIPDPAKPVTMQVLPEFTPPQEYPAVFRYGHSDTDFILIPFTRLNTN